MGLQLVIGSAVLFGEIALQGANLQHSNNAAGGVWSAGPNWTPRGAAGDVSTSTILNFGSSSVLGTTFTAVDDIATALTLNQLNFAADGNGSGILTTIALQSFSTRVR